MNTENVQRLLKKLATLLAILFGQRAREILSLMDIRNITMEQTCLIIRIGDLLKTSNRKFHNEELKSPKYISKDTIAGWIRETLSKAGIDVSIFSPHSTTSAASSTAKKGLVPIVTILKIGSWRSMKTFERFYDKG